MIISFLEKLIGSTGPYTVLTITLCNDLFEKNNFILNDLHVSLHFSINLVRAFYHQLDSLFFHQGIKKVQDVLIYCINRNDGFCLNKGFMNISLIKGNISYRIS